MIGSGPEQHDALVSCLRRLFDSDVSRCVLFLPREKSVCPCFGPGIVQLDSPTNQSVVRF